ncbi:aquaporin-9-like [Platichthys flesus]|uniref:aquaporin-9-like n=1 Tax=Platichthys flesus TaxID=8260 RepID=UPI002DBDA0BE|nr:aquaporin-9-like [Platichthys flesus]
MLLGLTKEIMTEFLGMFILVLFVRGSVAQAMFTGGAWGNLLTYNMGVTLGLMLAIYVASEVSGAYLNPAVTLAMVVLRRLPPMKFPLYVAAQFLGSYAGAHVFYGLYYDALMAYTNGVSHVSDANGTAHIFASCPIEYNSVLNGFLDQVIGTAALIVGILAFTGENNSGNPKGLQPLAISLIIIAIAVSTGLNPAPLNAAQDISPWLFAVVAGWGLDVFRGGDSWFWIQLIGPMVGGALGAGIYALFMEWNHTEQVIEEERTTFTALFEVMAMI